MTLRLGVVQSATDDNVVVKDAAHVFMSPDHFRAFAKVVSNVQAQMDRPTFPGGLVPPAFVKQ